jgi:putative Mg2+ transporter-C (MgtC) family protein
MIFSDELISGIAKLFVATIAGGIIGAEREYQSKNAGFRTVILITLGSCLFTIISYVMAGSFDPARIAANVITGIGFLGAGAIFKEGVTVKGLTTASVIWVAAAVGMAIGIGAYEFAFISVAFTMLVLLGFRFLQNIIDRTNTVRAYHITIVGHTDAKRAELEEMFKKCSVKAFCTSYAKRSNEMILTYTVRGGHKAHDKLISEFYETSLVDAFDC